MKLTSYGAAGEVTGSCHLLQAGHSKILLDCGLIQGRSKDELRNHDPFPFDPATLDAVVLSHAHIDHSGRLPILIRDGFRGKIYTHEASADLCTILLKDSASLNARDVKMRNKRRARKGKPPLVPLYSDENVAETLQRFVPMEFEQSVAITDNVSVRLFDAGHILGSAMVELKLNEAGQQRTVVFSGDLGHRGAPILKDFTHLNEADLVLMESTYGNRLHRDWEETAKEVHQVAEAINNSPGNVLIPAFSVGRSQMILYMFARYFKEWNLDKWKIFLDSPMAIEATDVYMKHTQLYDKTAAEFYEKNGAALSMPNLRFTKSPQESQEINKIKSGAIIIAGSGMCNGGRIRHHLKHNLWRPECHVIISGYQAMGSPGRRLVNREPYLKLWGEKVKIAAQIHTVGGLSAHADQQGMMDWYASFESRPPVLLVHGEPKAQKVLAKRIRSELGGKAKLAKRGKSTDLLNLDSF
jgi:metallo-beta-lactamase family protein